MANVKLQALFNATVDVFDPDDSIGVENTSETMCKYWREFLEAGFDVTSVVGMMSPTDI